MCGFVVVIGPGDPVPLDILNRMRDRLSHRGPDGAASWCGVHNRGSISMGFRRLAILDTSHVADQPMRSNDGRKVLVFNGAIYNYIEIRAELEAEGFQFRTNGDTEVLLHAYERWGDSMIDRLNGMFAFALWDQDRGQALIARDRFGEKPLFMYRLRSGQIAFASEIKALLAHPEADSSYDYDIFSKVLFGWLIFGSDKTLFKAVRQLPGGHYLVVDADGSIVYDKRYWWPSYDNSYHHLSKQEVKTEFRILLEKSVELRLRCDVPITACLSGGIDSSSLVTLIAARNYSRKSIDSVMSVRFPHDPTIDESFYIDAVLKKTGLRGYSVYPNAKELISDVRRMHWHHEFIIPGPSMYLEWALMREARSHGYKVIIDGQGADEVLAGYQCYFQAWQVEMAKKGIWGLLYSLFVGFVRDMRLRYTAKRYDQPERRFALRDSLTPKEIESHIKSSHAKNMLRDYSDDGLPMPEMVGDLRFELALHLLRISLPSNLYSGDRNSMAHGIECRYPYLDYSLVDFLIHLPNWAYIHNGWSKYILRSTLSDLLPKEVAWRTDKVGFAAPQDEWMRKKELKSWIYERINDDRLSMIPGYDRKWIQKLWNRHQNRVSECSSILWRWASAAELLDMQTLNEWKTCG